MSMQQEFSASGEPLSISNNGALFHMIGNAHLDPAWMWQWGEGMEAFLATCRSALDRMEETPGFIFTCSSAAHYRWVEEAEPELFERIRERVREGRWALAGGWWTQADCNLPSGEGFVRQALLGQRYFMSRFGMIPRTGYSPDAFGHNIGLPQLLARSGMTGYIFCRPDPTELTLRAPLLRWIGPDGSSVLAYRVPFHYNMYETSVPKKVGDLVAALGGESPLAADGVPLGEFGSEWMLFYGVGNHGGGPTREHIEQIIAIDADAIAAQGITAKGIHADARLLFSTPDKFFARITEQPDRWNIPGWRDDFQLNAPGCYSVHSRIKLLNRRSEHLLMAAERTASLASMLAGVPYPADELRRAWENVCFNHFHDILCGVAIREALEDAIEMYGESLAIAKRTTRMALQRIARRIDTTGPGQTLLVFNPHCHDISEHVTFELWHDIDKALWSRPVDMRVTDDAGNDLPCQTGFTSGKIGRDRVAATFRADLPALGWRCYRVFHGEPSRALIPCTIFPATDRVLENAFLRIEISPENGGVTSIIDKVRGEEMLAGPSALGVVIDDPTDSWGHGVERFDSVVGTFGNAETRLVEHGPTHATIRSRSRWGNSWLQQDFRLHHDSRRLDVDVRLFWGEERRMLKLQFCGAMEDAGAWYESPYSVIEKPCDGVERPGGSWSAIAGRAAGRKRVLAIVNDAKHGYSALTGRLYGMDKATAPAGSEGPENRSVMAGTSVAGTSVAGTSVAGTSLFVTVLRSPSYATHDPHPCHPDEDLEFIDQGEQRFRYSLMFPEGDDWRAELARRSMTINAPISAQFESAHAPSSPVLGRFHRGVEISPATVMATVIKWHEDGNGWIVRLFESCGISATAEISIMSSGKSWSVEMNAFEVRTFLVGESEIQEMDLTENRIQ